MHAISTHPLKMFWMASVFLFLLGNLFRPILSADLLIFAKVLFNVEILMLSKPAIVFSSKNN
jgi:hypothetical protein